MTVELVLMSRVAFRGQEITGPRLRGLLALLAGDLRTGCSTARLVEGLWPDGQPENPTKALQVLVFRARAQLGSELIASTPTGYRLTLSEDRVDSSAVLLSASASAKHARAGDHAAALAHAEAGLALWEGVPSEEVAVDDPVAELRAERASAYRSLVRARGLALARLGRHAEAREVLTALAGERPRDEGVLLELLRCEAATVGPAAALARYDAYRRALRDELGTDPGPSLQAAYRRLLQGEAPVVRRGVVYEPNPLLGRADDLAAVAELLRTSRVTSIVGPGGLGKTRLANAVSRQAEQRIVHVVPLAGVTADADVAGEVASVLGVGEARPSHSAGGLAIPTELLTGIAGALGPGPALLVLDNCEHVIRGAAELVQALVSMTKDLRVLTTSRAPLGLSSESVYPLPELDLPTTVELFRQRARAARPNVDLPTGVVEELCRHLDGLPLAVELAAARVRVMSVPEIAHRLSDRFGLLRGGPRDTPERHRTLQAVVDWSWNLLEPAGQVAMRKLSIFPDGFTVESAARLLGDGVVEVLEHLVDQSLLKVADTPSGTRFRMLETVREFSTAAREAAGETEPVTEGFLGWAREFGVAHHESLFGPDPFPSADHIRAEQDNLLQALRLGLTRADGGAVAAASAVLGSLWTVERGYRRMATLAEDTSWLLSHFRPPPELVEVARTASTLCAMNTLLAKGARAMRELVTLRRLPPAPPTTLVRATAILLTALPEIRGPDYAALQALCDSDEPLLAGCANGVASYVWEQEGDPYRALKAAQRMLDAVDGQPNPWIRVLANSRVGELYMQLERGDAALAHLQAALQVLEDLESWVDVLQIRWALVLAYLQTGAVDEAERWLEMASQDRSVDSFGLITYDIGVRAEIALARGEVTAGLRLWRRAIDALATDSDPLFQVEPTGLVPWALEVQAVAVVAHVRHGQLDLVGDVAGELPDKLSIMLHNPIPYPPPYVMELPIWGTLLLALAMVDLDRGKRTGDERATRSAVRMIVLAERLHFLRGFQPTMSSASARSAAEQADRKAYEEAVSSYAELRRDDLRAAALAALLESRPVTPNA